jgi:hypothetical protein
VAQSVADARPQACRLAVRLIVERSLFRAPPFGLQPLDQASFFLTDQVLDVLVGAQLDADLSSSAKMRRFVRALMVPTRWRP